MPGGGAVFAGTRDFAYLCANYPSIHLSTTMKVIADSSATRTEWALVDGAQLVEQAFTTGLNPYFQSRRDLSHIIRLELPDVFFRHRWEHVYFYGAGCATEEKKKMMASSLVAQFRTPVTVETDLLGAARGLLVRRPGLACIIGTGSNSCTYDGSVITRNIPALGFILGDEGSGADQGKRFVADVLKGIAPDGIASAFIERFGLTPASLLDAVYTDPMPSRTLATYAEFLGEHLDDPYVHRLVYDGFINFFDRNVGRYDYSGGISIVGRTAIRCRSVLGEAACDYGIKINKIIPASMPGLIEYHAND